MTTNLPVPKGAMKLPAVFQQMASSPTDEFTAGVQAGFGILSLRGKVWRIRKGGKEESYLDKDGDAVQSLTVVMVRANPHMSKIFYTKKYEEGDSEAPTCWSSDSVKPDREVQSPVSKTCAACPNNVWGSRISENGTKSRACSDSRRVAVVLESDLAAHGADATPFLLRIPPASLNPLREYAEALQARGIYPFALVTKIGFDPLMSHPKLTFKPVRVVTDEEAQLIVGWRKDATVKRILAESAEFVAAGTTDEGEVAEGATVNPPRAEAKSAPAAANPPKARKLKPAEEEQAAVEESEEEDEQEEAPTPPPAPVRKRKATATPAVEKPTVAAPAAEASDFDAMLDNILGTGK